MSSAGVLIPRQVAPESEMMSPPIPPAPGGLGRTLAPPANVLRPAHRAGAGARLRIIVAIGEPGTLPTDARH